MKSLISVIIPVYNQATALEKCLESIRGQSYSNIETIVIDDGSTDTLRSQITSLQSKFSFQYYSQSNKGAPAARNKGFELSGGEYVIFWDADIVGKSDMLAKMLQSLKDNPEASYSYSNFYFSNGKKMKCGKFSEDKLKRQNYITTTSLIKRCDFPGFDESLKRFQDWDLWFTMMEQNKFGIWIDEYLFRIISKGSISTWLPKFAYKGFFKKLPFIKPRVENYEKARKKIYKKHGLIDTNA
ncbi:MAG: glycosyltransferase [Candidatus Magasanikbacteria bacterium]|nr:glycosyltransferase [Candidatus Magasanikbacteria bacterium]